MKMIKSLRGILLRQSCIYCIFGQAGLEPT